ncbi:FIG01201466: hypothetical protein [hydrothermal vent metagenome]|uniref:Uncharacterized protein n=1 Tax=hydrothermal vent metagenome TaxID=652676 RepID=A0A3B1BWP2_9ZZZZ
MKKFAVALALALAAGTGFQKQAHAQELSGYMAVEAFYFLNDPAYPEQRRDEGSIVLQPEFYQEFSGGDSFTFVPFARIDSSDDKRTHFDIREMKFIFVGDPWEVRVGVDKVFWGVTEFNHLVDIVNQTDLVESLDLDEKLGQPMVSLSVPLSWGTWDFYLLPYFRERTFPGKKGRQRSSIAVDVDNAEYESPNKEYNIDFASRYSHTMGDWELGLSYFAGTSRDPTFLLRFDDTGAPTLIPYYEQIKQTGLDVQFIVGEWLWKLEAIYRTGLGEVDYWASDFGFEYSFYQVFDSGLDVGMIVEYVYDDRGVKSLTPFQNDIALGMRLALNDAASSETLIGLTVDAEDSTKLLFIEASTRLASNWRLYLETGGIFGAPEDDPLYSYREDEYLRAELIYYY